MIYSNADSLIPFDQLGRVNPPYKPTHVFSGDYINEHHQLYANCPVMHGILIDLGIKGWLRRADALKLYEMAYFAEGDILELGCHHGLSTSVLSTASLDSKRKKAIVSNDLSEECIQHAEANLTARNLLQGVKFCQGDSAAVCRHLIRQGRTFDFIFIDHSHDYTPVLEVCQELRGLLNLGGFCLFHDYNDQRNRVAVSENGEQTYGVYKGVDQGLSWAKFEFCGCFGCTGMFRAIA